MKCLSCKENEAVKSASALTYDGLCKKCKAKRYSTSGHSDTKNGVGAPKKSGFEKATKMRFETEEQRVYILKNSTPRERTEAILAWIEKKGE